MTPDLTIADNDWVEFRGDGAICFSINGGMSTVRLALNQQAIVKRDGNQWKIEFVRQDQL